MPSIIANTKGFSYEVIISNNSLSKAGKITKSVINGKKIFIVTDDNVKKLFFKQIKESLESEGFIVDYYSITPGEESKNSLELFKLYDKFFEFSITRIDGILALGGGVVGDLAGFAAATYQRGIPLVSIPTTLLAQVDSSVGGKTAIDMPFGKNMVGAFSHPKVVIIDPKVLLNLPRSIMNDGMAEVIKYGCIRDSSLFENIESKMIDLEWIIERCIKIKTQVVANDERDNAERMVLNFGHTVGHAIEKISGYKELTHGQAVSIGMVMATKLGEKLQITPKGTSDRIEDILKKYGLPTENTYNVPEILEAINSDKKNLSKKLHFVLLKNIGEGILYPIEKQNLNNYLKEVL